MSFKSNDKKQTFWKKYRIPMVIFIVVAICTYMCIYFSFKGEGILSSGKDLQKRDWLSFLGSYLSFIGTVGVSLIALFQSSYYTKNENERRKREHRTNIQPIFSINIEGINKQIKGTAEEFDLYHQSSSIQHKNVEISIENVNTYPINHIIVFDEYICPLLKSGEIKHLQCAYYDSEDVKKWKKHLIVLDDEYTRDEHGIPKWFNICYEDIDGQSMFQTSKHAGRHALLTSFLPCGTNNA